MMDNGSWSSSVMVNGNWSGMMSHVGGDGMRMLNVLGLE
jgi:hypothetical protein